MTSPTLNFTPAAGLVMVGVGGVFGVRGAQLTRAFAGQQSSKYSTMTVCWPAVIVLLPVTVVLGAGHPVVDDRLAVHEDAHAVVAEWP